MQFFILAGGYGKRAEPLTFIKPKPLLPLAGIPIIEIILAQLKQKSLKKGFINLHYKAGMIKDSISTDLQVKYLYEKELSGSKILNKAAPYSDDLLLVVNGDMYLDIPVKQMFEKIAAEDCDGLLLLRKSDNPNYPTIILENGCYVKRNKNGKNKGLMYTGAAIFKKKVIEKIAEINFFDTLDKSRFRIKTMIHEGLWLDIGTPKSYFAADSKYRNHIKAAGGNSIAKNVRISSQAKVINSIIWENTSIAGNSAISNCIVTGNLNLENLCYDNKIITKNTIYDL
jgi:NDP-sugar pyrophosphorylase family protein